MVAENESFAVKAHHYKIVEKPTHAGVYGLKLYKPVVVLSTKHNSAGTSSYRRMLVLEELFLTIARRLIQSPRQQQSH